MQWNPPRPASKVQEEMVTQVFRGDRYQQVPGGVARTKWRPFKRCWRFTVDFREPEAKH